MNLRKTLLLGLALMVVALPAAAQTAEQILRRQSVVITTPPQRTPSHCSVDAPLLGNGFTGVALSGPSERLVFHIARNDFWRLRSAHNEAYPAVLGRLTLSLPQMEGAEYRVSQNLWDAVTTIRLAQPDASLTCQSLVAATDDVLLLRLTADGSRPVSGSVALTLPGADDIELRYADELRFPEERRRGRTSEGIRFIERAFQDSVDIPTRAAVAMRIIGRLDTAFTLRPGETLTLVCAFSSNFKSADCLATVIDRVASCSARRAARIAQAHRRWWHAYWERSYVSIPDADVERQYYLSLYGMASCSRDASFPPPLFGTWITKERPDWYGDYHLNYNHMAPYYALYSANRIEQARPYYGPLLDFMERGRYYSRQVTGIDEGIMLPVGIGPLGIETTRITPHMEHYHPDWLRGGNVEAGGLFWGQKSNAAYAVVNLAMQFYHTWDRAFALEVYPFVRSVATFWEHYLTPDGGRYVILDDAIHEGTVGTVNPILSLGLVRMVMTLANDMSEFLGVDAERRPVWLERRDHLSDYPTQRRDGLTVFRYTERGTDWWVNNTLGIQHIYPGGQIGLESPAELLQVARNTIRIMSRWADFNGTNSFYPAAVRVGHPVDEILRQLHDYSLRTYPNGFQRNNPHGTENWSTVPNTVNLMLCTGHQNVVRLFHTWPRSLDASFRRIRCEGAFLVSARLSGGEVSDVVIQSEQGRPLTLQNPWPGREVRVDCGRHRQTFAGERIEMPTRRGATYRLRPAPNQ